MEIKGLALVRYSLTVVHFCHIAAILPEENRSRREIDEAEARNDRLGYAVHRG
jgi:hypothetical protein